ncbi:proline--tRNA ligase [Candidatus Azambacteria bacterium]|nr:proline--tRNA ligase [Candidatus Azambacteria bacterium]MBI3685528.1 proline--tRNA ligase [Candidatus Azambacteria bacterium]
MLQSRAFIQTKKEAPKDEQSVNAKLLLRGGYIEKLASGVYTFLPLGFLVLKRIERVIREEMDAVGGVELLMPALQPKELWEETGRWASMDVLYKIKDAQGREFALGATHEEVITGIVRNRTVSYKDLPFYLYQMQTKFRDELRAKSGILRGREFIMKDLYSFHATEEDRKAYYEKVKEAYLKIFKRCGVSVLVAEASGGSFSKEISHEFQVRTPGGEDIIIVCSRCDWAKNSEIAGKRAGEQCPSCGNALGEERSIEVGNIFTLGTKFSSVMKAFFTDKDGTEKPMIMGCYGMGLSRLMGAAAEVNYDERGIVWPREIAPYDLHLIPMQSKDAAMQKRIAQASEQLYQKLQERYTVLYDDRDASAGAKFADADLIGAPVRIVISEKTLAAESAEVKPRNGATAKIVKIKDIEKELCPVIQL